MVQYTLRRPKATPTGHTCSPPLQKARPACSPRCSARTRMQRLMPYRLSAQRSRSAEIPLPSAEEISVRQMLLSTVKTPVHQFACLPELPRDLPEKPHLPETTRFVSVPCFRCFPHWKRLVPRSRQTTAVHRFRLPAPPQVRRSQFRGTSHHSSSPLCF